MKATFYFSNNVTVDSEFILDTAKITENYYNNLKSADNSAQLKIPFSETFADYLKADISSKIKCIIYDDDNVPLFTGYVRNNITFSKTQRNQPISLEIVSPSLLLDVNYNGNDIRYTNKTIAEIIVYLLSFTGFSGLIDTSEMGTESLVLFSVHSGDNIKEVVQELLFEYGYVFNFSPLGTFVVKPIFNHYGSSITQHFDGSNCLNEIQQVVKEDTYNRINVNWNKVEQKQNVLIFEDTTNGDASNPANIEIPGGSYYLGEQNNYLNYDSKFQSILWIDSAEIDVGFDNASGVTYNFDNLGVQGELSIYNGTQQSKFITHLRVYGNGYFETSTNETKTGQSGKELSITAKYIQEDVKAGALAKKLYDYYNYANFVTGVVSKTKYEVGTFVDVSDDAIGTVVYRIVKRVWNIQQNIYQYTLESVSAYTPIETYNSFQNVNSKNENGESIRTALSELEQRVSEIVVETTMCSADNLMQVITLDSNGYTLQAQDIDVNITLKQHDIELPFSIGQLILPDGWSYTVTGKKLTFHIGAGVLVRTGQISIPVQYKVVVSEKTYVDKDGNVYTDENGNPYINQVLSQSYTQWNLNFVYIGDNGGSYRGVIYSVSDIPNTNNYGDYFVWGGPNNTNYDLVINGKLKQGEVYKYIGESYSWKFDIDTSNSHLTYVLGDVLGIANADLEHNNSFAYEYLDHLTANSIYVDKIVGNNAFIDAITSRVIAVGELVTVGNMDEAIAQSEIDSLNAAMEELGVDTLQDHTIISGGKIKTALINASAISINSLDGYSTLEGNVNNKADIDNDATQTTSIAIKSSNFTGPTSTTGFGIYKNGNAYFNNGKFRGEINATSGNFSNCNIDDTCLINKATIEKAKLNNVLLKLSNTYTFDVISTDGPSYLSELYQLEHIRNVLYTSQGELDGNYSGFFDVGITLQNPNYEWIGYTTLCSGSFYLTVNTDRLYIKIPCLIIKTYASRTEYNFTNREIYYGNFIISYTKSTSTWVMRMDAIGASGSTIVLPTVFESGQALQGNADVNIHF